MPEILGFIPARGGSKGVPGKNLKPLCGKPLISYTIEEAKKSKYINRVVVSSDCSAILKYCKSCNIETIERPPEFATDESLVIDAIKHSLSFLEKESYIPDILVNLNPTSPLRKVIAIDRAIEKLLNSDYDSVFGACFGLLSDTIHFGRWEISKDHQIKPMYDHLNMKRRQDLSRKMTIIENGSIYAIKTNALLKNSCYIGINPSFVLMSQEESLDINSYVDFEVAEFYLNYSGY
jgi:CMP-N-acetylneuraminic acid synthetase